MTAAGTSPAPSRRMVLGGLAAITALALSGCGFPQRSGIALPPGARVPLAIPPLAASELRGGVRRFTLAARTGHLRLLDGHPTPTAGFNGGYLGPTLRAKRGETVSVAFSNTLDEPTTVHWHGMHLPPEMDGGPHQMVAPGETWMPEWRIDQPAATLWYHPHPHGATEEQVYRGLAGLFLVDDPDAGPEGLPSDYGVDDIPLVVQDKTIGADGSLVLDTGGNEIGTLGSTLLVNGTHLPFLPVSTGKIRLRLLNGSTARIYNFVFGNGREFELVGTDGGLLERPVPLSNVRLSPGERAEIVVGLVPGETLMLRSVDPELGAVALPSAFGAHSQFDILELRAGNRLRSSPAIPGRLARIERLREEDSAQLRIFEFEGRKINGQKMDMGRIDHIVMVDTTEVWQVVNKNLFPHNFHVHDVQFQLLAIDGQAPPAELSGWKDTIYLEPRRVYRIIAHFSDFTSTTVPYMYHCHLLLHEDEGMMGQFAVVKPGETAVALPGTGHRH